MNIVKTNQLQCQKPNLVLIAIKTIWPSKKLNYQRFGPFTIMKQINVVAFSSNSQIP
jgi:hypothetical protein